MTLIKTEPCALVQKANEEAKRVAAVNDAIKRSPVKISGREGRAIHALLRGRG